MVESIEEYKENCKSCPNYSECKRYSCWDEQIKICRDGFKQ